jgi:hypothetical protein
MFVKILNSHRDFTPAALAPKKNFNRRKVIRHHHSAQQQYGGPALSPPFSCQSFFVLVKGIFRSPYSYIFWEKKLGQS